MDMNIIPVWAVLFGVLMLLAVPIGILLAIGNRERRIAFLITGGAVSAALLVMGVVLVLFLGLVRVRTDAASQYKINEIRAHDIQAERADEAYSVLVSNGNSPKEPNPAAVLDYRGKTPPDIDTGEPATEESADPEPSEEPAAGAPVEVIVFTGDNSVGERKETLPGWAVETPRMDGTEWNSDRVLASLPWATIDEAEAEMRRRVAGELSEFYRRESPESAVWPVPTSIVDDSKVVARRCNEVSSLQVGEFNEPIHRVYWQLEYDPEVWGALDAARQPLIVRQRLIWLGGAVGLLTVLFGSLGAYSRVNIATGGQYRGRLRFATAAVCAAVGLAATMLA